MKPDEIKRLTDWLARQGAEVLAPTNPYELVRFRARGGVHVIYTKATGRLSIAGFAKEALAAFHANKPLSMGITKKSRNSTHARKVALVERDGGNCFYCDQPTRQHYRAHKESSEQRRKDVRYAQERDGCHT